MSDPITLLADPEGGSTLVLDLPRLVARLRDDPTLFRTLESLRRTVSPRDLPAPDEVIRDDRNRILVRGLDNDWREFTGGVAADGDPTAPVVPGDEIDAVIVRTQGLFAQQAQMNALTLDTALVGDVIGNVSGFASSLQTPITLNGLELNAGTVASLVASDIQSGAFDPARIPDLDAAKVASGTLDAARIPLMSADKINEGILPVERGGTGVATSTGSGNLVLSSGPTFGGTIAAPTVQTGALVFETPTLATPTPPELDEARATFWIDTNANTAYLLYRPPGAASPIRFPIAAEPDP